MLLSRKKNAETIITWRNDVTLPGLHKKTNKFQGEPGNKNLCNGKIILYALSTAHDQHQKHHETL